MSDPEIKNVKVGDTVVVTTDANHHGGGKFAVASVGRKWFTVVHHSRTRQFSLVDGRENSDGVGSYCYARTPGFHAEQAERAEWVSRLMEPMRSDRYGWERRLTTDQIKRIVAIMEEKP